MTTLIKKISILAFLLVAGISFGQQNKIEKANKDFDRFAYIDAREVYLKVIEDGYRSAEIYKKLGDTYYWNSDYGNAAKWYSKLIEQYPGDTEAEYYYRASQSLKSVDKYDEADRMMEVFAIKGGNRILQLNFEKDPNYLKSISLSSKDYALEKAAINTATSDFGPSFYLDKLVYSSTTNTQGSKISDWTQQPYLDLFVADMDETGKLSNSQSLSGDINTAYHETSTTFTKDGNTAYFTRNNFIDGKKGKDKQKTIRLKLYRATKSGDNFWTNIVELPFNSDEYSVAHPALSVDGKKLYFSSDMPGTLGMSDLWHVDITGDNTYSAPKNLGADINTEARESFPFIDKESKLYFSTDGRAGLGGYDIFVTQLSETGKAGEIVNLGEPANSNKDDFGFIYNPEKRLGYLSSNRDGDAGSIDDEIYSFTEKCIITITGTVFDEETKELLPGATVTVSDKNNKELMRVVVGGDGRYTYSANCDEDYTIRGVKEGYFPREEIVKTPKETGTIEVPLPLKREDPCPPNDLGCRLTLQPIYFDFDKHNIRPDAEIELAKILAAMRQYPELIIHIESHTDSRGSDSYNEALSERRAQSTLKWLVGKGIDANRLTAKGYGETQHVNKCANGVTCTSEEHQMNRRSMFIIKN